MRKIIIGGDEISYAKEKDLPDPELNPNMNEFYKYVFTVSSDICSQLEIPTPDIALYRCLRRKYKPDNIIGGFCYTPDDDPNLETPMLLISYEIENIAIILGIIAHEHRHIWQYYHAKNLNAHHANGFDESTEHPAEIDADGYAIYFVSNYYGISMDEAANFICPEEKKKYPAAYSSRLAKAHELKSFFDFQKLQSSSLKNVKKNEIFEKLKHLISTLLEGRK